MSKVAIEGNASGTGTLTIAAPNTNTNRTITLPDATGTLALAGGASDKIEEGDSKVEVTDAGTGKVEITVDAVEVADFTTGAIVFNETGANQDFRVEGDTEANLLFVDASTDRVGIGTATPGVKLQVQSATNCQIDVVTTSAATVRLSSDSTRGFVGTTSNHPLVMFTNGDERARIDNNGSFLFGTTSSPASSGVGSGFLAETDGRKILLMRTNTTGGRVLCNFGNPNGETGSIQVSASATSYVTSSDYRLKENIATMTGALAKVAQLNPVTYTWKADGSDGQGFIAHELAEVVPDAVSGSKDAVNEDGSIKPQGVDTSFLVATLTAAIQELKVELDQAKTRIAALENNNA